MLPHDPYLDQWRSLSLVRGGLFGLVLSRKAAILGAALVNLFGESPASKMGDIFLDFIDRNRDNMDNNRMGFPRNSSLKLAESHGRLGIPTSEFVKK